MSESLTWATLSAAMSGSGAALRSITVLQPIEGEGGKVFPATYSGGKSATEKRRLTENGLEREVECVLLNSVHSEVNHAELALLDAIQRGGDLAAINRSRFQRGESEAQEGAGPGGADSAGGGRVVRGGVGERARHELTVAVQLAADGDGYTNIIGPTDAIFPSPISGGTQLCLPNGSTAGACHKWFGRCIVE